MKAEAVLKYHCSECAKTRANGQWEIHIAGKRVAGVDWINDAKPGERPRLNERQTAILAKALAQGYGR